MDSELVDEAELSVDARFPSAEGLRAALSSIRSEKKQMCVVVFSGDGLTVKWESESKAMQSGIFLGRGLFSSYTVHQETQFSLPLYTLLDTLAVFASSDMGELTLRYPGPNAELLLESVEASVDPGAGASMAVSLPPTGPSPCTYARVSTLEGVPFTDILEYVEEPTSYFIGQGLLLKEAVYDMEWTKGDVAVELRRDPSLLKFTSSNQGRAIEVEVPVRLLSTFHCAVPSLKWAYRAPNLRNVFANIAQTRGGDLGAVTKVAIDAKGLMKVTHMLRVATAVDGYQDVATHPLASAGTQAEAATAQRLAVAQFALLPLTDEGADADEEESRGVDLTDGDAMTF